MATGFSSTHAGTKTPLSHTITSSEKSFHVCENVRKTLKVSLRRLENVILEDEQRKPRQILETNRNHGRKTVWSFTEAAV